ncbi:MAG: MFS transporter [Gammaproteobacteria bacterium]|nr:MFS transporter [Gammaproteobacteria bacterium]
MARRIFVTLWVTYAAFYLGRVNFSVAMPEIMAEFGWTRSELGVVVALALWAYAIGQVVNGQLGDRFGARHVVYLGLLGTAAANLLLPGSAGVLFGLFALTWVANGYLQSAGWAPIVRTLTDWTQAKEWGKLSGRLATSYIFGSAVSVALAGYLVANHGWRVAFYVPAGLMLVAAVHWFTRARDAPGRKATAPLGSTLGDTLANSSLWMLGVVLALTNIVRYGFLTWVPLYLVEQGQRIDLAAYSLVLFPVAGIVGSIVVGHISDRVGRVPMVAFCLTGAALITLAYLVSSSVFMLMLVGFFTFGAHALIVTAIPADLSTRSTTSSATGFVDGLGYIGAGVQGLATGLLVDSFGWPLAFVFWATCAFLGAFLMATFRRKVL